VRQTNICFAIPLAQLVEMLTGTLTDLHAELSKGSVRISGHLLDLHGSFEAARLNVRVMKEDAVPDLLSQGVRWKSIAPKTKASSFTKNTDGSYATLHELPKAPPGGSSVVAQIIVKTKGFDRYLPPSRVAASDLSVTLLRKRKRLKPRAPARVPTRLPCLALANPTSTSCLSALASLD
jgi:hypothetical protein